MKLAILHLVAGPDLRAARQLHDCHDLNDEDVMHILFHQHGWDPKSHFRFGDEATRLPHFLQSIIAGALVLIDDHSVRVVDLLNEQQVASTSTDQYEIEISMLERIDSVLASDGWELAAWQSSRHVVPLLNARRALLNTICRYPTVQHNVSQGYIAEGEDNDEAQLDHVAMLQGLTASPRPLNPEANPHDRAQSLSHAQHRALQVAWLAVRQNKVAGSIDSEQAEALEAQLKQLSGNVV